jgi:dienelactone hydrolase
MNRSLLWMLAICAGFAQAQTPIADFRAGPGNGVYTFASSTPRTLADLVDPSRPREATNAIGQLFLPEGNARVPAVVLVHGAGGLYPALLDYWPKQLNRIGIAAFVIDVFTARGVQSTADDQSLVPFGADVADAFAALGLLASHPRIGAQRIAIMGVSRGGIATTRTAVERIAAGSAPPGLRFAAQVSVYSSACVGIFRLVVKPGMFGAKPMLWVHGDADDYVGMKPCQDYAQRIGEAGTPVEFVVIPGARHKFDLDGTRRIPVPTAQRTRDECPLQTDVQTLKVHDARSGAVLNAAQLQAVAQELCAGKGASVEGNHEARYCGSGSHRVPQARAAALTTPAETI